MQAYIPDVSLTEIRLAMNSSHFCCTSYILGQSRNDTHGQEIETRVENANNRSVFALARRLCFTEIV